jgi:hypothetical protein
MKEIEIKVAYQPGAPSLCEQLAGHVAPRAGKTLEKYAQAIRNLERAELLTEREVSKAFDRLTRRIQTAVNRWLSREKAKVKGIAATVRAISFPSVSTPEAEKVLADIQAKAESFAKWIETQAQAL